MDSAELRKQLIEWLDEIKSWSDASTQSWDDYFMTDEEWINYLYPDKVPDIWTNDPERNHLHLFTANNEYHISFSSTYLSGHVTTRTRRTGENWDRGNDMPDGSFSKKTWDMIMHFIIQYELVAKVKHVEPIACKGYL